MGCCESTICRKDEAQSLLSGGLDNVTFSFQDVVPIKYYHYLKEYEFEKNLPGIKERISNFDYQSQSRKSTYQKLNHWQKICLQKHQLLLQRDGASYFERNRTTIKISNLSQIKFQDHPNIPRIIEVFIYQNTAHLVKEQIYFAYNGQYRFCRRGFLSSWVSDNSERLTENMIISLIYQLLSAIQYLHSQMIVHTNIRMETILISTDKQSNVQLQLMSFDNAVQLKHKHQILTTVLQATEFIAPEVFIGKYNQKIDEYAAGILMYHLITDKFPFQFSRLRSDTEFYWHLINQDLKFNDSIWLMYQNSIEIKEVIEGLLKKDPCQRLSARKALQHPLFKLPRMQMREINKSLIEENINFKNMKQKRPMNIIKRGMLLFIATRLLPDSRYQELTQLFQTLDQDADGYLQQTELKAFIKTYVGDNEQLLRDLDNMFTYFSDSVSRKMSFGDFIAAIIELRNEVSSDMLKKAFIAISSEESATKITRQQLFDTIKNSSTDAKQAECFLKQMDKIISKYSTRRKKAIGFQRNGQTSKSRGNSIEKNGQQEESNFVSFETFKRIMRS